MLCLCAVHKSLKDFSETRKAQIKVNSIFNCSLASRNIPTKLYFTLFDQSLQKSS